MERINSYYPFGTERITHKGKSENIYRLDAIDQPVRIKKSLKKDPRFRVINVKHNDESVLNIGHSSRLIKSYKTGKPVELAQSSGLLWQKDFYPWVINKAWATIKGAENALGNNRSLVITSGGHHAEFDHGHGFGPISNMVIAAKFLLEKGQFDRLAILDLDVHFANGTHSQVANDKRILSCDLWRYRLDKWIYTPNSRNIFHKKVENINDYTKGLNLMFDRIVTFKPNLLFVYNGLDPLSNDRMGGVSGFDTQYLFTRNKKVADFVKAFKLPVCVFIGGGYINYKQPKDKIEKSKVELTKLFIDSSAEIFGV